MNSKIFIEAVASGLRNIDIKPNFIAIICNRFSDWEYDENEICGIPVLKCHVNVNSGESGYDFPVIPCFINVDESKIFMQTIYFQKGFTEVCVDF